MSNTLLFLTSYTPASKQFRPLWTATWKQSTRLSFIFFPPKVPDQLHLPLHSLPRTPDSAYAHPSPSQGWVLIFCLPRSQPLPGSPVLFISPVLVLIIPQWYVVKEKISLRSKFVQGIFSPHLPILEPKPCFLNSGKESISALIFNNIECWKQDIKCQEENTDISENDCIHGL